MEYKPRLKTQFLKEEKEYEQRKKDFYDLLQAQQLREEGHPQFDGMSYSLYNETNEMADMSYMPPKKNKYETKITTGITREKDSSFVSFFSNFKFEPQITVYKGEEELTDLGIALTSWVRASREAELYDKKRPYYYRNFVVQGTSFVLEKYEEISVPKKKISNKVDFSNLPSVKWTDKGEKILFKGCKTELIDGKKVFLQNIREPFIENQPVVFTVEYTSKELLESIWGDTKQWKEVPEKCSSFMTGGLTENSIYSDFRFHEAEDKYEVVQVYRQFENTYQIYINGIPMLPLEFPLEVISPSGRLPFAKGDSDPINMFAYSKSEPAKTKIDQATMDVMLKIMLIKFQQSAFPPRGNLTGKLVNENVLMPSKMTANVRPEDLPQLIDTPGVTNSDFGLFKTLKEQIDNKTMSSLLEGQAPQGQMTLGQYMDMQKKSMLKIGGKIDGIINWERDMVSLRLHNLLRYANEKQVQTNTEGESGEQSTIVKFAVPPTDSYDVLEEEVNLKKKSGKETKVYYLNPKLIKDLLESEDYRIHIEIVPVDKNNDKLAQIMYIQMITQAINIFGIESMAVERLKKSYAAKFGEKFENLFLNQDEVMLKQMETQQQEVPETEGQGNEIPQIDKPTPSELALM